MRSATEAKNEGRLPEYAEATKQKLLALGQTEEQAEKARVQILRRFGPEGEYVVETIHEGSDWCVRKATASEIADPDEETLPYDDAADLASQTAREFGCKWFDFSSDPAPDEEETT